MKIVEKFVRLGDRAGTVGFVPTMGALHEGHYELVRRAAAECERVVVSIFVNPLQFGAGEDFEKYPRDLERDAALLERAGVDVLWTPERETFVGNQTVHVDIGEIGTLCEGEFRPGHFSGVATIVTKLFNCVQPDFAYFGLKDRQQCAVVSRLVESLNFALQLRFVETVRDSDGLALSSRNAYLSVEERARAASLYANLRRCREEMKGGKGIDSVLRGGLEWLEKEGFRVEYLRLVDGKTFRQVPELVPGAVLVVAAKLGHTRLIDNIDFENN